jgi:hypothetical protein
MYICIYINYIHAYIHICMLNTTRIYIHIGKEEEPGLLRLLNPVKRLGKPDLINIELWPRCAPDGLLFKVRRIRVVLKLIGI